MHPARCCFLLLLLSLSACNLISLDTQLKQARRELLLVSGELLAGPDDSPQPALVALLDNADKVAGYRIVAPGEAFYFSVPHGSYQLLAFVDTNGNFVLDANEPRHWLPLARSVALHIQPNAEQLASLRQHNRLRLNNSTSSQTPELDLSLAKLYREHPRLRHNYLQQVTFNDPRFSAERTQQGIWQPMTFKHEVNYGLYLLRPWDPALEPVFFVHGINDSPSAWQTLAASLDPQRHQAVLYHYPSGAPLNGSAYLLKEAILDVQLRHAPPRIHVVAHSMGGLVARRSLQMLGNAGPRTCLLLTLATPWNGHPAAANGVDQSPVVVPAWRDVAPGSDFLKALFAHPLPAAIEQWQLVSYGGNSLLLGQPNDGVVPLASQLRNSAQDEASHLYLLNQSHTGILHSPRSQALLKRALGQACRP